MTRDELIRLLPQGIDNLLPYLDAAGFFDVYDTLCEVMFYGDAREHLAQGGTAGTKLRSSYHFRDARLFPVKKEIDLYLTKASAALRRWEGEGRRHGGQGHQQDHDLGRSEAGRTRHHRDDSLNDSPSDSTPQGRR